MNFIKRNLSRIALIAFSFLLPIFSLRADSGGPVVSTKINNPIPINSLPDFIKTLLQGFITIGLPIVALALVYCGFLFVAARGNSEKLGNAKRALLYTLIGAALLLGSWAIAQMITTTVTGLGS